MESASSEATGDELEAADSWCGLSEPAKVDHEAEYVDEDHYTSVTVEAMDASKAGLYQARHKEDGAEVEPELTMVEAESDVATTTAMRDSKRAWTKDRPMDKAKTVKTKRKKFRYESKAERKFTRVREKMKNSRQAKARREDN